MSFVSKLRSHHGREVSISDRHDMLALGRTNFDRYINFITSKFDRNNQKTKIEIVGGEFSGLYSA